MSLPQTKMKIGSLDFAVRRRPYRRGRRSSHNIENSGETSITELRRIQSKYANLTTSSEAFARRKAEEIELEDRRR